MQSNSHDGTMGGENGEGGNQKVDLCRNFLKHNLCCCQAPKQREQNVRSRSSTSKDIRRRSSTRIGGQSFTHFYTHAHKGDSNLLCASAAAAAP